MNADEVSLIEEAKKGSRAAFNKLFLNEQKSVVNLMFQLTGDIASAEDLTQEAMIMAYKKIMGFHLESSFRTWLSKIAINLFRAHYREKRKHETLCLERMQIPSTDDRPERIIIKRELQWCILHNLQYHLSEKYRLALVLRDLHNLSYQEISQIGGWNLAQTKSYIHRARKKFKEQFINGKCKAFADDYTCVCEGILDL